jgi:hypothetical protein
MSGCGFAPAPDVRHGVAMLDEGLADPLLQLPLLGRGERGYEVFLRSMNGARSFGT